MPKNTQHVQLVASSFLDLISKQARLEAAVRAFLFIQIYSKPVVRGEVSLYQFIYLQKMTRAFKFLIN